MTIQLIGISAIHQAVTARWRRRIRCSAALCSGVGGSHRGKYFRVAITGPIAAVPCQPAAIQHPQD